VFENSEVRMQKIIKETRKNLEKASIVFGSKLMEKSRRGTRLEKVGYKLAIAELHDAAWEYYKAVQSIAETPVLDK
jgi:hypothetical protein